MRHVFITDQDKLDFIRRCEVVYNRTTKEFMEKFKGDRYEGNVDEKTWYRFASYFEKVRKNTNKPL